MIKIVLTSAEIRQVNTLLTSLMLKYGYAENNDFIKLAPLYAHKLPRRLLIYMNDFKYSEDNSGVLLIRGYPLDKQRMGDTPLKLGRSYQSKTLKEDLLIILLNTLLGDPVGWSSQRNGELINDIFPLKEHEGEQLSTGSVANLEWHTEEAFHPFKPDYVGLFCLRNDDQVVTFYSSLSDLEIPLEAKELLFEKRYVFTTDKNFDSGIWGGQPPESVLFGSFEQPYVKIDPAFMNAVPGDEKAEKTLQLIIDSFNKNMNAVALEPGDFLFMDNFRVVHGRQGFVPRYDGTDRWLKRVIVVRDIRRSREARSSCNSRVIETG